MNKPIQYQKGYVEFYKLRFKVNSDVLIPRPETELLVDEILKELSSKNQESSLIHNSKFLILDIGTGAGNIAISLALHLRGVNVKIFATDVSQKALKVARKNAKFHHVEDKIKFIQSNLLEKVTEEPDIIVTNLPYIPSARIPYLDSSVKDFEPLIALDGGEDGFGLYRKLFQQIATLGVTAGWHPRLIIGEIDYTHGELAVLEAQKYFPKAEIEVEKDLAHLQRILLIRQIL